MSKFNITSRTQLVENKCGAPAYNMNDKDKLVSQVLTTFFNESKFYGDNSEDIMRLVDRVIEKDPQFVANLALYARREFHMRSISHVLTGQLAHAIPGKPYVKDLMGKLVERPDDMTEILAFYLSKYGKPIPASLRKGLNLSLRKFDEYSLQKYNNQKKQVKLKDILMLVRPKPAGMEQQILWKKILENTLKTPYTWETELSKRGNTKEVWEELIDSEKVGYMALLRNLRNIINAKVSDEHLDKVCQTLSDKDKVLKSKQLPFRYFSAYREIKDICSHKMLYALETAIEHSLNNMPKFKGTTLIAGDVSGSMGSSISKNSKVKCSDIVRVLLTIANKLCERAIVTTFDTRLYLYNVNSSAGILKEADKINFCGGGTDITLPLEFLLQNNIKVDRIILFSDNEINCGYFTNNYYRTSCQDVLNKYKKINPEVWFHGVDLQGYGTQQFAGPAVNLTAGWSEKVFQLMQLYETGTSSLVKKIENYHLR